ncbi:MAG: hypothetical protein HY722_09200 [Planctomycetes bacterium]|nr:hypothetical protein [Planctomycetota bacterium]
MGPSLFLLLLKVVYFLVLVGVCGWALAPRPLYPDRRIGSWVAWQVLGTTTLFICGFSLVRMDIPARWLAVVPPALLVYRAVANAGRRRFPSSTPGPGAPDRIVDAEPLRRSLLWYAGTSALVVLLYLFPFVALNTSGLQAYGGGDQSSYFRMSDLLLDESLGGLVERWESQAQPAEYGEELLAPSPNWSIHQLAYYLEKGASWTFATQTIGLPFMALAPGFTEESYTAGVTVLVVICCWGAALLVASLPRGRPPSSALAVSAAVVAVGSPVFSLALKHATPALCAWGVLLHLLAVLLHHARIGDSAVPRVFFALGLSTCILLYLPGLLIATPLLVAVLVSLSSRPQSRTLPSLGTVALLVVLLVNVELERPLRLILSNVSRQLVDYGLHWEVLPLTVLGIADFDTILSSPVLPSPVTTLLGLALTLGFPLAIAQMERRARLALLLLVGPFAFAIPYYYYRVGHYHVIRLSEFVAIPLLALSGLGFLSWTYSRGATGLRVRAVAGLGALALLAGALPFKAIAYSSIIGAGGPNPRASMLHSGSLRLSHDIVQFAGEVSSSDRAATVYWMGWGAVQAASNDILFRRVNFLESIEFDYTGLGDVNRVDVLDPVLLANAILVYPDPPPRDILEPGSRYKPDPRWTVPGYRLFHTGSGAGSALVGTGWLPPTRERGEVVRHLRGRIDGGLVIWSEEPVEVLLGVECYGRDEDGSLVIERGHLRGGSVGDPGVPSARVRFDVEPWGSIVAGQRYVALRLQSGVNVLRFSSGRNPASPDTPGQHLMFRVISLVPLPRDIPLPGPIMIVPADAVPADLRLAASFGRVGIGNGKVSEGSVSVENDIVAAGDTVLAAWTGMTFPAKDDWIGMFPLGGDDASRISFGFTGGEAAGSMTISIPEACPPGRYELRLYWRGTWYLLSRSRPFEVRHP